MIERRATPPSQADGAYILAVLYTIGYLGLMFALLFHEIPQSNRELMLTLVGIMSAAELGIIKYFFDGSKGAEKAQAASSERASQSAQVLQEIARTVPAAAAIAAATPSTGAPTPDKPIQADAVNIDTQTTNINQEVKP